MHITVEFQIYSAHSGFPLAAVSTDGCVIMGQDSLPLHLIFIFSPYILYENGLDIQTVCVYSTVQPGSLFPLAHTY